MLTMRSLPDRKKIGTLELVNGKCIASSPSLQGIVDSTGQGMSGEEVYNTFKEGWMNGYIYADTEGGEKE